MIRRGPLSPTVTCVANGQHNGTQPNRQHQLIAAAQAGQQLAAGAKQRADAVRFSFNIADARPAVQAAPQQQNGSQQSSPPPQNPFAAAVQPDQPSGLTVPRAAGEQIPTTDYKRPAEVNIDQAVG